MKQRNFILFLAGTMALFGLQVWLTRHYAPPPQPTSQAQAQAQTAAPSAAPSPAPAPAGPAGASAAPLTPAAPAKPGSTRTLANDELKLTWRESDGALIQAEWKDGTRFFPDAFMGLGSLSVGAFDHVVESPTDTGTLLTFANAAGDELSYELPRAGHVLRVRAHSARGAALLALPLPTDLAQVDRLERVFTLNEKGVNSVKWQGLLKDPFWSFLGAKRDMPPPATAALGLDAGLESGKAQAAHYFAALWQLPSAPHLDASGYLLTANPNGIEAQLYLGPKEQRNLAAFGKPFTQVVDFGFFGAVAQLLFVVLRFIQKGIPDWGWAIVLFTVLLRTLLWPLNTKQTRSMLRMKDFEPHQKALQAKYEKFGNDMTKKAEMQKELMELYKKNGHNPFGSCLPMLLQMPVFFALFSMLRSVFELRHAQWAHTWIHDLSATDPYKILPVAMAITMLVQNIITPAVGDPQQRKMMMFMMPIMMGIFFMTTPAGLCLYYLIFNLVGLFQTWWVSRTYVPEPIKV